jgi:hypothetical protein
VSTDYVVRLEQSRTRRVSRPVLDALADALQLAPDERAYLFAVADVAQTALARQPAELLVDQHLRQLLDGMHDIPALVLNRRQDVLAWNSAAAALLADFSALPPGRAQPDPAHFPRRRLPIPVRGLAARRARVRGGPADGGGPPLRRPGPDRAGGRTERAGPGLQDLVGQSPGARAQAAQ